MASSDLPATSEVLLPTDAGKHIPDNFQGQNWDTRGTSHGGSKGLSFFQAAIPACIGFSINLGNYVWELGTNYFVEHGEQLTVRLRIRTSPTMRTSPTVR
ncbi:hypothetical protein [uncultured Mailhella sp.]|uniref:hypothetical protein n=1 Tax=uncultured Mailhella sp. TaxID=1981031 RepID=UPI002602AD70|nr:hypothetical protein [uncultured Mailhella sp.]